MAGFSAFLIAFGIWDIFFYVFLKLLIDWPASLMEWDLLFLLPVPWSGPVLAPVLVALSMVGAGSVALGRAMAGRAMRLGAVGWLLVVGGGVVLVVAFCCNYRTIIDGGMPERFPWVVFALGEAIGLLGFVWGLSARGKAAVG